MLTIDETLAKELGMTELTVEKEEDYQSIKGIIKEDYEYSVEITKDKKYEYIILRVYTMFGDAKKIANKLANTLIEKDSNILIFSVLNREPRVNEVYGSSENETIVSYLQEKKHEFVTSYGMVEWDIREDGRKRLHSGELFVFLKENRIEIHEDNGEIHTFELQTL